VDASDSDDLDGDVDLERDSDDEEEKDEEEEDDQEDEEVNEDEVQDKDEEEDKDKDDGKEPWTIGPGVMIKTLTENVHTMVDDQRIVLPEQDPVMGKNIQHRQPPAAAPWPQTPEPCFQP
jgi:hypothetical protein